MRVLYHLAYPDANMRNEVFLIERFISALNNREVQNYVCRRKPPTYTKALHIANEETSFILMNLAKMPRADFRPQCRVTLVLLQP